MADVSSLVRELTLGRKWPRDYAEVKSPCWYLLPSKLAPDDARIEDPDFAPEIRGTGGRVAIWPKGPWALYVQFDAMGRLSETEVVVHDGLICADGDLGPFPWPGLDRALVHACRLYAEWEAQMLEARHG